MASDLTGYKVASNEQSSSTKFDNLVQRLQDTFNAIGDETLMAWAAGKVLDLDQIGQSGASNGAVPQWNGSAWVPVFASGGGVFLEKLSSTDVKNTAAKTDLFGGAFSIPANALAVKGTLRILAGGDYLNDNADVRRLGLELALGSSTLWDSATSEDIPQSGGRRAWSFDCTINSLDATNKQRGSGLFVLGPAGAGNTGIGTIRRPDTTVMFVVPFSTVETAANMTVAQTLTLKVYHNNADANTSMRCHHASVQVTP